MEHLANCKGGVRFPSEGQSYYFYFIKAVIQKFTF